MRWVLWALLGCAGKEAEVDSGSVAAPETTYEGWGTASDGATDRDGDGAAGADDCNDFDASVSPSASEVCGNGLDDDCSGAADCEDAACAEDASCASLPIPEICWDEVDNDNDGDTDCRDSECTLDPYCSRCNIQVSGSCDFEWSLYPTFPSSTMASYACEGAPSGRGREVVYEFMTTETKDIVVSAEGSDPFFDFGGSDVSLFLLEGSCFQETCSQFSERTGIGGREDIRFTAEAYRLYYFIVEDNGGDMLFTLGVRCTDP